MSSNREPVGYTCPDIDCVIEAMEQLRKSNEKLREWGQNEASGFDDLEVERDSLLEDIERIKEERDDLASRVEELEQRIADITTTP